LNIDKQIEAALKTELFQGSCSHLTANLLLALNLAPNNQRNHKPPQHTTVNPASKLTPPSTPNFSNIGGANKTAAAANKLLASPLAASNEAAYLG